MANLPVSSHVNDDVHGLVNIRITRFVYEK